MPKSMKYGERCEGNHEIRGWALSRENFYNGLYSLSKKTDIKKYGSTLYAICAL